MKLNLVEKKGLIALLAILIFFAVNVFIIGSKNLWFESKNTYYTFIKDAEGLRVGSLVTLNGLHIGQVTFLEVYKRHKVKITFSVRRSLADNVREDAKIRVIRAFVIGDKRLDLVPGSEEAKLIPNKGVLVGEDSMELADLISGRNLARIGDQMKGVTMGIQKLAETIILVTEKVKPAEIAKTYEILIPTMENLHAISQDLKGITKEIFHSKKTITPIMNNGHAILVAAERDFIRNKLARDTFSNLNKTLEPFAKRGALLNQVLDNTALLSQELVKNPDFAVQLVTSLKEMVVTLKAIQRTWLLDEYVKKIKKEAIKK